jgi:hypothetical protein
MREGMRGDEGGVLSQVWCMPLISSQKVSWDGGVCLGDEGL